MDVTNNMYFPSGTEDDRAFNEWLVKIQTRLGELSDRVGSGQVNNISLQLFRLNRPSPRCPIPTREMRKVAIQTAIVLIKEYANMGRSGKLFYTWYAAHYLVEIGASLLDAIISGLEMKEGATHLTDFDISTLGRTVRTFPLLLSKVASNWLALQEQAVTLEKIAASVFHALEHAHEAGSNLQHFDFTGEKEKLSRFLLFSQTTSIEHTPHDAIYLGRTSPSKSLSPLLGTTEDDHMLGSDTYDPSLRPSIDLLPHSSLLVPEIAPVNVLSTSITERADQEFLMLPDSAQIFPGLVSSDSMFSTDQYYTPYTVPRAMNAPNLDLAVMDSEQIFAALMEGVADNTLPHLGME